MIACAALRFKGRLYLGRRHHNCFMQSDFRGQLSRAEQGFVTTTGKFVTRSEAAKIAYENGQIRKPVYTLYSEDLY